MTKHSRTWWGQKFISALESFTDSGRLQRGRAYSGDSRILHFDITKGLATATIRGNVNPYFGVYKEPLYGTEVKMTEIAAKDWTKIIANMSSKASVVTRLLLNEVPENIEDSFTAEGKHLLPYSSKDFHTECTCPDYSELGDRTLEPEVATSYFTKPQTVSITETPTLKQFWQGQKRLPQAIPFATPASVSAIAIKKQGDNPPFWKKDSSFIETMETLYDRVKNKNSALL
jgi:uncharacterized Zn finger protein